MIMIESFVSDSDGMSHANDNGIYNVIAYIIAHLYSASVHVYLVHFHFVFQS